jgi:solute carrier family 36 (proton-coupled amino acid transporter)
MIMIALGVMLGYAIQFFVAIQIMFSSLSEKWTFACSHPILAETLFRTLMVLVTFVIAEVVPNLSLLLSLIGSVCCVILAFVFPVLAEFIILKNKDKGIGWWVWTKNSIILFIALAGFIFGGGTSISDIINEIIRTFK